MTTLLGFLGRLLIALLFVVSGLNKLFDVPGTESMIVSAGLPGGFAAMVGVFELVAGLALIFGAMTRLVSVVLAVFCLATAFFFHNDFMDPTQAAMLLKNLAIAGGLLCLCAPDSVRWSYDAMRKRRIAERAALRAEHRAHDAEVRAARAEGAASVLGDAPADRTVVTDPGAGTVAVRRRRWFF
jgi:putative oxidoreductase